MAASRGNTVTPACLTHPSPAPAWASTPPPATPPQGELAGSRWARGRGGEWARVAPKNDSKKKKDQSEQAGLALTTALPAQARHLLTGETPACVTSITEEAGERLLPSL